MQNFCKKSCRENPSTDGRTLKNSVPQINLAHDGVWQQALGNMVIRFIKVMEFLDQVSNY
jgi:hypothetical protein